MIAKYKIQKTFEERLHESTNVLRKYTHKIPIICEKIKSNKTLPDIDRNKFLIPIDITVGQFMYIIRMRMSLSPNIGIYLLINDMIPASSECMYNLYNKYKDEDGFLYVYYTGENTFG